MKNQEVTQGCPPSNQGFMPPPYQPEQHASSSELLIEWSRNTQEEMATGCSQFDDPALSGPQPSAPITQSDDVIHIAPAATPSKEDTNSQQAVRASGRNQAFDIFAVCRGFKEMWYYGVVAILWPSVLQWKLLRPYPKLHYLFKWGVIVDAALYVALITFVCHFMVFIDACEVEYEWGCSYHSIECSADTLMQFLLALFFLAFMVGVLVCAQTGVRVYIRWSLRQKMDMKEGTKIQDCCVTTFCTSLSLIQLSEAQREEKILNKMKNVQSGIARA